MDPKITGEVTIELDKPCTIRYGNYSLFRLSRHAHALNGRRGGEWGYHQVLIYAWAMLSKPDLERFPDPEDLAEYITPTNLGEYLPDILAAINVGLGDKEKKTLKSKTGPSAATRSA